MNNKKNLIRVFAVAIVVIAGLLYSTAVQSAERPIGSRVVGGIMLHDRGPAADRHEDGYDVNIEYQYAAPDWEFWQKIGSPRPHAGVSLSTNNETSILYGGITYEMDIWHPLFAAAHGGLALHDGPLHQKDIRRCEDDSDCGFGSRILFRGGLEVGMRLTDSVSLSVLWDHVSHGKLLASENEGIDHIGLRVGLDL